MPTFAEYLEKWLKQSTAQGLTNPLVKMPVKRFRLLHPDEFGSLANGGSLIIGTMSEPIARNLHKNYLTRIRERGEHCAFVCAGSVEMIVAGGTDGKQRKQLFPVCLKRASFQTTGDKIKAVVAEDEAWQFNPVLQAHLRGLTISVPASVTGDPVQATNWVKTHLGNRASHVTSDSYVGLFSSQQIVVQNRLSDPPLKQALAKNPVIQAKVAGRKIEAIDPEEITDDGLEELGLALPCDDSQLRVVQLSHTRHCLQVEGPPGTGKSQTIANIISNALYHGRNVLLVCDKKAAIVQVEERLSNVGLKPAMLNLHDEDLDKKEFLKQATDKFPAWQSARAFAHERLAKEGASSEDPGWHWRGIVPQHYAECPFYSQLSHAAAKSTNTTVEVNSPYSGRRSELNYRLISKLIADGESETVDFKIRCDAFDSKNPDSEAAKAELVKDICAMSNNRAVESFCNYSG